MFSFRGDAWKFYIKLRKTSLAGKELNQLPEMSELENIKQFYAVLDRSTLQKIRYRMLKEKSGSGIIPLFVTTIPWLLFIFAKQLTKVLFQNGSHLWMAFIILYLSLLIVGVILHFREKAWAAVHVEIIDDLLEEHKHEHEKR